MIQQVGKYILESELGRGAMGSVWLSKHPGLDIPVAVKILDPSLVEEDPDYRDRFIKEGKLAASINHQNVVRIIDAGQEGPVFYLVMELIDGADAKQLVEHRGALPVEEVLELAICTAEALKEAHSKGIVHRDIKPDNILVTSDGKIKVADLGIAKQVNDDYGTTMAGTTIGTPYYIAPEQAMDSSTVDRRCDIYALGGTLYHLLTGTLPFTGPSAMAILMKHTQEELQHPKERKPDLPENICNVVCKMMEKHPDDRYQDCDELLKDLKAVKNKKSPGASRKKKHIKAPSKKRLTLNNFEKDLGDLSSPGRSSKKISKNKKTSKSPLIAGIIAFTLVIVGFLIFKPKQNDPAVKITSTAQKVPTSPKAQQKQRSGEKSRPNKQDGISLINAAQPYLLDPEKSKKIQWSSNWSLYAEFKGSQGPIICKTTPNRWVKNAKALYINKSGFLVFDIGMTGNINSSTNVNDGKYHKALLTSKNGEISFYVNGELKGTKNLSAPDNKDFIIKIGASGNSTRTFNGHIKRLAFWNVYPIESRFKHFLTGTFDKSRPQLYYESLPGEIKTDSSENLQDRIYTNIVRDNPGVKFNKSRINVGDKGIKIDLNNLKIHNISSLKGLPIVSLKLYSSRITDHSPLKDLPTRDLELTMSKTPVSLKNLNHKTLKNLNLTMVDLQDLSEFSKFNLDYLGVKQHPYLLNYLEHMALHRLDIDSAKLHVAFEKLNPKNLRELRLYMAKGVEDISAIKGFKLKAFHLTEAPCTNIDVLKGMPLDDVSLIGTAVKDASILSHSPIRSIAISHHTKDIEFIHTLKRLKKIAIPFRHWSKHLETLRNSDIIIEGYNRRETHWWLTWGQIRAQDSKEFWERYDEEKKRSNN